MDNLARRPAWREVTAAPYMRQAGGRDRADS